MEDRVETSSLQIHSFSSSLQSWMWAWKTLHARKRPSFAKKNARMTGGTNTLLHRNEQRVSRWGGTGIVFTQRSVGQFWISRALWFFWGGSDFFTPICSAWFTESKSVCWETTKVSKVVFSSLFFSHRITVKPLPRQLDLAAASCHFPAQTNTLQRVRHFFFYLRRPRFKPILGSRDFLYFFSSFCLFVAFILFIYLFYFAS